MRTSTFLSRRKAFASRRKAVTKNLISANLNCPKRRGGITRREKKNTLAYFIKISKSRKHSISNARKPKLEPRRKIMELCSSNPNPHKNPRNL
jgi:hypothetical protein